MPTFRDSEHHGEVDDGNGGHLSLTLWGDGEVCMNLPDGSVVYVFLTFLLQEYLESALEKDGGQGLISIARDLEFYSKRYAAKAIEVCSAILQGERAFAEGAECKTLDN